MRTCPTLIVRLIVCTLVFELPSLAAAAAKRSAPSARAASVLEGVKELDKPVTYTETKIPLGDLVQQVAKDTGAPLTAAKEVADEPVAVVVKGIPARELLEQVVDLLDYQWSRRSGVPARERGSEGATGRRSDGARGA